MIWFYYRIHINASFEGMLDAHFEVSLVVWEKMVYNLLVNDFKRRGRYLMQDKEKEVLEYNSSFLKRLFKSVFYALIIIIGSTISCFFILGVFSVSVTNEQASTFGVVIISIAILSSLFFCTFTILEEIRKINR